MRERIAKSLDYLEGKLPALRKTLLGESAPVSPIPMLDSMHRTAFAIRQLSETGQSADDLVQRFHTLETDWQQLIATAPEALAKLLTMHLSELVRRWEIDVRHFCAELSDSPITRPDVLRQIRHVLAILTHEPGTLRAEAYRYLSVAASLTHDDVPELELTDYVLEDRRELAIALSALQKVAGAVPSPVLREIQQLDRLVLDAVDKALTT